MQEIIAKLTAKDDKYACAIADKIISESQDTDEWYEYFDTFASLLNHPKSLVRNRALSIIPAIIFMFSGIMSRSVLLIVASLLFAPTHILISYKNAKC